MYCSLFTLSSLLLPLLSLTSVNSLPYIAESYYWTRMEWQNQKVVDATRTVACQSVITCATFCGQSNPWCERFSYEKNLRLCFLNPQLTTGNGPESNGSQVHFYRYQDSASEVTAHTSTDLRNTTYTDSPGRINLEDTTHISVTPQDNTFADITHTSNGFIKTTSNYVIETTTSNDVIDTTHTSNGFSKTTTSNGKADSTQTSNDLPESTYTSNRVIDTTHTNNDLAESTHTSNGVTDTTHTSNNLADTTYTSNDLAESTHTSNSFTETTHTITPDNSITGAGASPTTVVEEGQETTVMNTPGPEACVTVPDYWAVPGEDTCVKVLDRDPGDKLPWTNARAVCTTEGGRLLRVENALKREGVLDVLRASGKQGKVYWLDATDSEVEGTFFWGGGVLPQDAVDTSLFEAGQPDNGGVDPREEDCLMLTKTMHLADGQCGALHFFICERS